MKSTFSELGIPFPLYEAPVSAEDDSDFVGDGICCLCVAKDTPCFRLGIGSALIVPCPSCHTQNALRVADEQKIDCRDCGDSIAFPESVARRKEPKVCYSCLRAGKAALTKDTEFGMVSAHEAFAGVTNGVPGLKQDQFDSVILNADEEWIGVRLPREVMDELLRTPTYGTWQGECWLFCCRYPMTFVGEWGQDEFESRASDGDGQKLFSSVLPELPDQALDAVGQGLAVYVFECKSCGNLRAHYDSD